MLQQHVTAKGFCTYCKSKLRECVECGEWFSPNRVDHLRCRGRCRTRKVRRERQAKKLAAINEDDGRT